MISRQAYRKFMYRDGDVMPRAPPGDRALDWAERAYGDRVSWLAYLSVNPFLDTLGRLPRLESLVRRIRR